MSQYMIGQLGIRRIAHLWNMTDGHCWYCGCELSDDSYSVDHQLPVSRGGKHELANLVLCCRSCNSSKNSKTVEEFRLHMQRKSVGVTRFTENQIEWLLSRGIDVQRMIEEEAAMKFYGERIA